MLQITFVDGYVFVIFILCFVLEIMN